MHLEKYSHFANKWRSIFLYNRIVNEQVTMHFLFRSKKKKKEEINCGRVWTKDSKMPKGEEEVPAGNVAGVGYQQGVFGCV